MKLPVQMKLPGTCGHVAHRMIGQLSQNDLEQDPERQRDLL
jgi:hypothetical protein